MKPSLLTRFACASLLMGTALICQAQTKWDLPTAYPTSNFVTENIIQFVQDVDKASGGKLKISVHANASLFKATEIKRAVQGGQVQIGEVLFLAYENEWPIYGLEGLPYLARGYREAFRLYQIQKPLLEKKLNEQGMQLLFSVAWPPHGIYTKREIASVADMKGLKWRAYSPTTAKMADLFGGQPVTIQQAELTQALATGMVDSYMSSSATGVDTKTYEQLNRWYDMQILLPKTAVIVSKSAFNSLDKPTQDALLKMSEVAEKRGWKASEEKNEGFKKTLTANGMKVLAPSPKLATDFQQLGAIILTDWLTKAGPEGKAVIDSYRK